MLRVQRDAVGQSLLAGRTRLYFKDTAILKNPLMLPYMLIC